MKKVTSVVLVFLVLLLVLCELKPREITEPLYYTKEIKEVSEVHGIDPFILAAIARTESSWLSDAQSSVGALGLMQIMPETALYLAQERGLTLELEDLYDPRVSLDYGAYYLKKLYGQFKNWDTVFAAYNAGPTQVSTWLEDDEYSKGKRLTFIPFEETRRYVEKVNYFLEAFNRSYRRFP